MKKSILSVMFLVGLFIFANAPFNTVLAQEKTGGVEIKDVKITAKDDKIEISAVLFNPSQNVGTSPFTHFLTLSSINQLFKFRKSAVTPPSILVSAVEGSEYTSLKPQEQKAVHFSLPISPLLPKNNYTLNISMILPSGENLDYYQDVIYGLGSNQNIGDSYKNGFLAFDQRGCVIITPDGKKFGNNDGPILKSLETPNISCAIKNVGKEEITVFPQTEWKEFFVYGRPSSGQKAVEKSDKATTFKSGEIKTIELSLPAAKRSQVYQALISFVDKNSIIRSYNMPFRWTIGGPSARVEKVALASPLKAAYEAGETVSLSVDYFGSMDLFWGGISDDKVSDLSEVKILALIKDKRGAVCGQKEESLPDVNDAGIHNKIINIKLDKKCVGLSYNTSFSSSGKKLADAVDVFPAVIDKAVQEMIQEKSGMSFIYYIMGAFILAIALKIIAILKRRRHKDDWQKNLILFLFITGAAGFFLGGFNVAEAARTLTIGRNNLTDNGSGTITGPGINCFVPLGPGAVSGDCSEDYINNAQVILTGVPTNAGFMIYDWTGGGNNCPLDGDINICRTNMGADKIIRAKFRRAYTLNVGAADGSKSNLLPPAYADGSGKVSQTGINCNIVNGVAASGDCSESYASGSLVNQIDNYPLNLDNIFAGWTGDCSGAVSCFFPSISSNKIVNNVFYKISTLTKNLASTTISRVSTTVNSYEFPLGTADSIFTASSATNIRYWRKFEAYKMNFDFNANKTDITIFGSYFGCSNASYLYARVKMAIAADGLAEKFVNFKTIGGSTYDSSYIFQPPPGTTMLSYEIDPNDLALLPGKTNPRLILYFTGMARPFGANNLYFRRGTLNFSYTDPYNFDIDVDKFDVNPSRGFVDDPLSTDTVWNASDVIKIIIPLVLPPPNNPPILTLDPPGNQTINENQSLTITASATDMDTGDILTYSASSLPIVPSPLPSGASFAGQTFSWMPTYSQAGTYNVRFTVNDGKGGTDSEDIEIKVNNVNQLPVISAGSQHTLDITPPTTSHTHSGATASDPDGDSMTYTYTWTSCPGALPCPSLTSNTGSVISGLINGPAYIPDEAGNYNLQLSVSDGTITATAPLAEITNTAPAADAGSPPHTLTVGVSHTHSGATASDVENGLASYTWSWDPTSPCQPSCPSLGGNTGSINGGSTPVSVSGPGYTPTTDGNYILKLTITDNMGAVGEATLTETATSLPSSSSSAPSNWWDLFNNIWKEQK